MFVKGKTAAAALHLANFLITMRYNGEGESATTYNALHICVPSILQSLTLLMHVGAKHL